jgi:hypothetical protein
MFSTRFIRSITLSIATLIAAPAVGPTILAPTAAHAGKRNKQNKNRVKKAIKKRIAKKLDKRRDQRATRSIKRTRMVLRAALRSVKKHEDGKGRLAGAVLHQRAAVIALKKDRPRAALWLTRQAREMARDIIRENKAEMPAGGGNQPGEFVRADQREAPRFLQLARQKGKKEMSPEVKVAIGKTRELVLQAAKAVKSGGGKEKDQLRKAIVQQKAARKAGKRGKDQVALHLTGQARQAARAVIEANGGSTETGNDAELATADATGSEEFTADAEATVATDIDADDAEEAADDEIDDEVDADLDDEDEELEATDDTDA